MSLLNQSGGDYYVCNDYGIIFDKYCDFTTYKRGIWFPSSDYTESTPPSQRTYDRFFISDGIPYITSEVTLENGDNIHNNICCDLNYSTFFKNQSNGIDTVANKSYWSSDYGLYTNNSDIAGVRNIFFYEISSSTTDGGLLFKKSSGWDKFWIRDGVGYIGINYTDSNNPTGTYTLLSTGNYSNYVVPTTRTVNGKALSSNISLTAADVGAVSQTVYQLTPQNSWKAASAASACHLIVTGRLAAITARLTAPSATINSSNRLMFKLPSGVVPTKYIDVVMTCGGDISNAAGAQIGTDGSVVAYSGTLPSTGPLSIDAVFLIN